MEIRAHRGWRRRIWAHQGRRASAKTIRTKHAAKSGRRLGAMPEVRRYHDTSDKGWPKEGRQTKVGLRESGCWMQLPCSATAWDRARSHSECRWPPMQERIRVTWPRADSEFREPRDTELINTLRVACAIGPRGSPCGNAPSLGRSARGAAEIRYLDLRVKGLLPLRPIAR